ncbi:MAG: tetratricopeptide repeat protein [Duncaniella sp.]|nr:tetratricopeptide repeat protein [Duncaniella sp.]
MDNNLNPDDSRQSLYEEFLSEVVRAGNQEAYFDEQDLVEIFDYSSDMDNYIAKMEVLLYGARHYPDSQPLATRRAWFYSSFGEMDAAAELNERVSNGGVLNELLRLTAEGASDTPATRSRLDAMVDANDDFADEELIQLVDFCAEARMLDWVERNYERVKAKCSYPQTFIYEYANRCEEEMKYGRAVALFEELTMMEPFTVDFWERLAAAQYREGLYDAALSSAEYAMAISPQSPEASRIKGMALYALGRDFETVAELMTPLLAYPEANDTDLSVLVGSLVELGRNAEAVEKIKIYMDTHPVSRPALGILITISPADGLARLREYAPRIEETVPVREWAMREYVEGKGSLAASLIGFCLDSGDISTYTRSLACEIYFANEMYPEAIAAGRSAVEGDPDGYLGYPALVYSLSMAFVRVGMLDEAREFASQALGALVEAKGRPDAPSTGSLTPVEAHVYLSGLVRYLFAFSRDISRPDSQIDPLKFNPGV